MLWYADRRLGNYVALQIEPECVEFETSKAVEERRLKWDRKRDREWTRFVNRELSTKTMKGTKRYKKEFS